MARVLMVDDDREFLEAGKAVLEAKGHTVILAVTAEEGRQKAISVNPDIIFLDIMMESPDDGIALANKLKKDGIKAPIVMLSGVSRVTGYEYGKCDEVLPCTDFLEKPVNPQDLLKKIDTLLKK